MPISWLSRILRNGYPRSESGSRSEQVQSWDSKPETSEPLCGKVEWGSTQSQTLRIACRATLRDQLKSRSEKRGELAMPAFRVEGDATAPLRGFVFLIVKNRKKNKSIKKQKS